MIEFLKFPTTEPYLKLREYYENAIDQGQNNVEAISISSYDIDKKEVNSRLVNLKYILNEEWIFFSNYNSPKASEFYNHNQISALLYWDSINVQIRIKAVIKKTSKDFSNSHFDKRDSKKNSLAISSRQSEIVSSYEEVVKNFENTLKNNEKLKRPDYWGGFSFTPYLIEFWEGHPSRINKRKVFKKYNNDWESYYLQP